MSMDPKSFPRSIPPPRKTSLTERAMTDLKQLSSEPRLTASELEALRAIVAYVMANRGTWAKGLLPLLETYNNLEGNEIAVTHSISGLLEIAGDLERRGVRPLDRQAATISRSETDTSRTPIRIGPPRRRVSALRKAV
jgi:hypothetical protein